jgi:hypothetical protein
MQNNNKKLKLPQQSEKPPVFKSSQNNTTLEEVDEKKCTCCKIIKPVTDFYPKGVYKKTGKIRYGSHCKKCHSLKASVRWSEDDLFRNRQKNRGYKYSLMKNYGLTEASYLELYKKQNNCCAICKNKSKTKTGKLFVDHCHDTGNVRGLLCRQCNTGIGFLGDDIERLANAIMYLKGENHV